MKWIMELHQRNRNSESVETKSILSVR